MQTGAPDRGAPLLGWLLVALVVLVPGVAWLLPAAAAPLVLVAGLAALAASAAWGLFRSVPGALLAGLVVSLSLPGYLLEHDGAQAASARAAPYAPAQLLELVVPDLFRAAGPDGTDGLDRNLVVPALLPAYRHPASDGPPGHPWRWHEGLYVGLLPLLLALHGLLVARGQPAAVLRLTALAALAWTFLASPILGLPALILHLGVFAGWGLAALAAGSDRPRNGGAALAVASVAVVLTGALAVLALSVGAEDPAQALAPLLRRLAAAGLPAPSALALQTTARLLGGALDAAALTAFVSLTALLLFLKGRGRVGLTLVLLVAVADLARPLLLG